MTRLHSTPPGRRLVAVRRGAVLGAIIIALAATAAHAQVPRGWLGWNHAKSIIRAEIRKDHPAHFHITGCHRLSIRALSCHVVETGVQTLWTFDGQPIMMTLVSQATAVRHAHGVAARLVLLRFSN